MRYKKEVSRIEDGCDAAKCKHNSSIILSYIKKYTDSSVELCDSCYAKLLEEVTEINPKRLKVITPLMPRETEVVEEIVTYEPKSSNKYSSIEDYTKQTGKRFRMTKAQKEAGLNRLQAFEETHGKINNDT